MGTYLENTASYTVWGAAHTPLTIIVAPTYEVLVALQVYSLSLANYMLEHSTVSYPALTNNNLPDFTHSVLRITCPNHIISYDTWGYKMAMISQRLLQRLLANARSPAPGRIHPLFPRFPNIYCVSARGFSIHNIHCDKNKNGVHGVKLLAQTTQPIATSTPGHGQPDILRQASLPVKDQRSADWAIMKEMAKYLWPKVRFTGH